MKVSDGERESGPDFWPVQCRMQPKRERAFDLLVHTICRVGVQRALCTEREGEGERGAVFFWRIGVTFTLRRAVRGRFSGEVKKK